MAPHPVLVVGGGREEARRDCLFDPARNWLCARYRCAKLVINTVMRPLHNDAGGAGAGGGRGGAEGRRRWGLVIARAVFRQKSETE